MQTYINGKFLLQRSTGVQRVAHSLVRALDTLVAEGEVELLCPIGTSLPQLKQIKVRKIGLSALPLTAWEQFCLPLAARDGLLLSLAGSAPAFAKRQIVMMHDAAVFDFPSAYRFRFVIWYRFLYWWLARYAASLVTVSNFSRDRLSDVLGIDRNRFVVIPNGADHLRDVVADENILHRLGLVNKPFILAVASINPSKNLRALLDAHAKLGSFAPRLVLVGGENSKVFSVQEIGNTQPNVTRACAVGDQQLVALYRHAEFMVFPSLYEGFGLPPLEALGQGCPVLAAPIPAVKEACGTAISYLSDTSALAIESGLRGILESPPTPPHVTTVGSKWVDSAAALLALIRAARDRA
jgi:glycosyltransferase involved in cell wall biosynthesis